ncbi:MAG TPA: DUF4249 family protein [Ignavibacteriaceae bacterium]|jgi:hypothetical protein|nr:DUF4249 family protein [Ignavibacteriaceae bacterium]
MEELSNKSLKPIVLKTMLGYDYFNYDEIIMFKSNGHNSLCFTVDSDTPIKVLYNISYIEKKYLNDMLFKCNRSSIVNLKFIKTLEVKTHKLHLVNDIEVKVSEQCMKLLKEISFNWNAANSTKINIKSQKNNKINLSKRFCRLIAKSSIYKLRKFFLRIILLIITIVLIFGINRCENVDKFYRPNLPESLCTIGIINIDDTTYRHISFEKSFQSEYSDELNDSLRDFSFSISSAEKDLFNYYSDSAIKGPKEFEIPVNIEFSSGEKYFLNAREKSTSTVSAITIVPQPPAVPHIISINREIIVTGTSVCFGNTTYKLATIEFSFVNNPEQNFYYAIVTEEILLHSLDPSSDIEYIEACQFDVKECNTTGFFARVPGLTQNQIICVNNSAEVIKVPYAPYIIEGSRVPFNNCIIKISTIFHDDAFIWKRRRKLKIMILSIPRDLFLYEKSLYTYARNSSDPFSEPVYLNGNIMGGNGVFAICRSAEIVINLSPSN